MYDPTMDSHTPHPQSQLPYSSGDMGDRPPVTLYDPPAQHQTQQAPPQTFAPPPTTGGNGANGNWEGGNETGSAKGKAGFFSGLDIKPTTKISKKWQRRLYWIVPLSIVAIVFAILFEVYKDDFERWISPLSNWLKEREAWSWLIPTAILVILSFPPLFGHEIVQLIVGLAYPLGVAIGIACAGAVLGEAACFIVFRTFFTGWVDKKIAEKVNWAATTRVTQQAGFRGVLVIRYSIVPPHLANPLFSCTGMKFWLYMVTVVLSLPKSMVFVALGSPSSKNSKAAKYGKVVAIAVVVIITLFASIWIRKRMVVATREVMAERGLTGDDEELGMLNSSGQSGNVAGRDTSYHGAGKANAPPYEPYQSQQASGAGSTSYPQQYPQQNQTAGYDAHHHSAPEVVNEGYTPYRAAGDVEERPLGGQSVGYTR